MILMYTNGAIPQIMLNVQLILNEQMLTNV